MSAPTDDTAAPSVEAALFTGDTGVLSIDTRRALVQLLLGPSVDGRRHAKLWPVLVRDEAVLRSRLHELFLDLVVDTEEQVAFTRQAQTEDLDSPILLRRTNLSFLDTALLLFLRQRLAQATVQGERAVVTVGEITDHLKVFERSDNVDRAKFSRQIENALEKGKKLSLLQRLKGSDERFEVSPTLKLLFPAEEIELLTSVYRQLRHGAPLLSEVTLHAEGEDEEDGA